jgi:hypothetical protein
MRKVFRALLLVGVLSAATQPTDAAFDVLDDLWDAGNDILDAGKDLLDDAGDLVANATDSIADTLEDAKEYLCKSTPAPDRRRAFKSVPRSMLRRGWYFLDFLDLLGSTVVRTFLGPNCIVYTATSFFPSTTTANIEGQDVLDAAGTVIGKVQDGAVVLINATGITADDL